MTFADAAFWIARTDPTDQWHEYAVRAENRLGSPLQLVTTYEVLTEFLAAFSKSGAYLRAKASDIVRSTLSNPNIVVMPQDHDTFLQGLARYENRPDKAYSLQDCISMNAMEAMGIREILTSDHHFEQEGFVILMKDEG